MAVATSTALIIAAAAAVAGAGVSAYGQIQQGRTAKKVGEYNAKVAENQALQADMDSRENIRRKREENRRLLATQRGRYAKAGVIEEGTPLEVMAETAGLLELDALEMGRQSRVEASLLRSQARASRAAGNAASSASYIGAGATLLNGASSVAGMYAGRV